MSLFVSNVNIYIVLMVAENSCLLTIVMRMHDKATV